jgi:hypothetical protein
MSGAPAAAGGGRLDLSKVMLDDRAQGVPLLDIVSSENSGPGANEPIFSQSRPRARTRMWRLHQAK